MRVAPAKLTRAVARQVRACLSELPDAPSTVRNEMLSIASTLRYLSAELEHGGEYRNACSGAADRLQAQLRGEGLDLPADVPVILKALATAEIRADQEDKVFGWLVEFLHTCNQAELGMYRQGLQAKGEKS